MKLFICLLFFISSFFADAQKSLLGIVIAKDNNQPLAGAVVFISNTTIKSITNNKGEFILENLPVGKFDVIVTFIGYETYFVSISYNAIPASLSINLIPKTNLLQEVTVEAFDKDGWNKWGNTFIEHFIGTSDYALDCTLENKEVVKFIYSKNKNTLKAIGLEPLTITNKALGYQLQFQLEEFYFNMQSREILYKGFPLFIELTAKNKRIAERWKRNRQNAYEGSIMHFMRALYRNKIGEEGFEVRQIIRSSNPQNKLNRDILITKLLSGDSIAHAIDSTTAGLQFTDYLQVSYIKKSPPNDYVRRIGFRNAPNHPTSKIFIRTEDAIAIFSNGVYYEPTNLMAFDYWAWSEKIAHLLPTDYKPLPTVKK